MTWKQPSRMSMVPAKVIQAAHPPSVLTGWTSLGRGACPVLMNSRVPLIPMPLITTSSNLLLRLLLGGAPEAAPVRESHRHLGGLDRVEGVQDGLDRDAATGNQPPSAFADLG